jgi:O-antigen biosynthesis protein
MKDSLLSALKYLRQFKLRWSLNHCNKVFEKNKTLSQQFYQTSLFTLENFHKPGWYMLEVKIKHSLSRINTAVNLVSNGNDSGTQSLAFPLYSGRLCKRLIHSDSRFQLGLHPDFPQEEFKLQHFRFVRVTRKFAHSRMLKKLKALHPSYKMRQDSSSNNYVDHSLISLWADYCDLFEDSTKIMPYSSWTQDFDKVTDNQRAQILMQAVQFKYKPLMSIVMPVHNPNPAWLSEAIKSVRKQIYQNWELCIADDGSTDSSIRSILEDFSELDSRIKVVFREKNGHISAASNSAMALVEGEWIALLDHDDVLVEEALFWVIDAINRCQNVSLIYSDEDKIDEAGMRSDPYFKPDWNQDLFYSQNMFSHLGVYKTQLVREVGGFRVGYEGSQDYDLALRCIERVEPNQIQHIPRVLYHWRIHQDSTAHSNDAKPYAQIAGEKALNDHLQRKNIKATAKHIGFGYRVRYELPSAPPLVSIVIPTKNKVELLKKCINSIQTKTEYTNYEIIIMDNGSDDSKAINYLKKLAENSKIQVVKDTSPFNYSKLNNDAVSLAKAEVIALLNNDVEIINNDWLTEMVSHALRPEVGVVGAKLYYADNTIQHAGVILGIHGVAGHGHRFLPKDNVGYCGRANLIQSFSAVTGACMVVRKSIYLEVGGMNEHDLIVACNDIDFCLKVREAGYRNIWTPYAELYHHESSSRGYDDTPEKLVRSAKEVAYMKQRWGELIENDPAYNPNLTLDSEDFSLAWPPRLDDYKVN